MSPARRTSHVASRPSHISPAPRTLQEIERDRQALAQAALAQALALQVANTTADWRGHWQITGTHIAELEQTNPLAAEYLRRYQALSKCK